MYVCMYICIHIHNIYTYIYIYIHTHNNIIQTQKEGISYICYNIDEPQRHYAK